MKKATFITIVLLCTLMITACGNENVATEPLLTAKAYYAECEIDRQEIKSIKEKLDCILENQNTLADSINELGTSNGASEPNTNSGQTVPDTDVPVSTTKPSVDKNSGTPTVSILYNGEFLAVPVSSKSKLKPFELTYPGHPDRDLYVMVSGNVSRINLVDEKGSYIGSISYTEVNNLNCFYFNMANDGNGVKFYFQIVVSEEEQYYFGIDYHV